MAAALALSLATSTTLAHTRSTSYSAWRVEGERIHVRLRASALDLTRLDGVDPGAHAVLSLRARVDGRPCSLEGAVLTLPDPEPGLVERAFTLRCPAGEALEVQSDLLAEVAPSHVHLARLVVPGMADAEHVLVEGARSVKAPLRRDASPRPEGAGSLVILGARHVLSGADHLAFLAALLLAGGPLRGALAVLTGFTLGHTLTLALAALGVVAADASSVEALVGLSVALVAAENLWLRGDDPDPRLPLVAGLALAALAALAAARGASTAPALAGMALSCACYLRLLARSRDPLRARAVIAALFGLVHGLGFAGGLAALELAPARLGRALLGFNVGVELGQVIAAFALLLPLSLLRRASEPAHRRAVAWASGATLALGTYWLVLRALAPGP